MSLHFWQCLVASFLGSPLYLGMKITFHQCMGKRKGEWSGSKVSVALLLGNTTISILEMVDEQVIKCYTKPPDGSEDPLILAICTPLMSRVRTLVQQASEVVYIDSSSSLDNYNKAVFVLSTSSAAGGLPLGVVVTLGESTVTIENAMSTLNEILPECGFGQRGRDIGPQTIITDDSNPEREGLKR